MASKIKPLVLPAGIGEKIDLRQKLKADKEAYDSIVAEYESQILQVEAALMEQMDREGTTKGGGKSATVSASESVVPQVTDWEAFYKFIHRMKWYHLLERRPSVTGCRELFETKGAIPGVMPFTKRKLTFTSKKG
jgi:hypothetical protein